MNAHKTWVLLVLTLSLPALPRAAADQVSEIIAQATLPEYQSYLRVLTGLDPIPGDPPRTITGRYASSDDARAAGAWIQNQFSAWGLTATAHNFSSQYAPNIIGQLTGLTRPQDIYIVTSHYDTYVGGGSQAIAPGCDDNGSGTAAVLTAAHILSRYQFGATLRFVTFSAEEQWMVGSLEYARQCRLAGENVRGVLNWDMILHPGFDNHPPNPDYDVDIEADPNSAALGQYMAQQYATYTSIAAQVTVDANNASDHWAFWQYRYAAVGLAENTTQEIWGGSNSNYHTINDTMAAPDYDWQFGMEVVRGGLAGAINMAGLVPEPGMAYPLLLLMTCARTRRQGARVRSLFAGRPDSGGALRPHCRVPAIIRD